MFRVIAVTRNDSKLVQGVRLYQYDKEGNPHPAFWWQSQAVIDFEGNPSKFEACVKGMPSTISFENHQFKFNMGETLGLTLKMALNEQGRISVGTAASSALLVRTTNIEHWRWILDNGDSVSFST